jgi:hypothetical protein
MLEIEATFSLTASLTAGFSSAVTVNSGVAAIQQHEMMVAVPRCGADTSWSLGAIDMGQNGT